MSFSPITILNEINGYPYPPSLSDPTNGQTITDSTPTLTFATTDAESDDVTYEVQVDSLNTFNGKAYSDIQYIGKNAASSNSIAIPNHRTGDLLVIFAGRDGNTTAPTVPSGWTNAGTNTGTNISAVVAYKIATSSNDASGTWTNATSIICHVYRNASSIVRQAGASGTGTTIDYSGISSMNDPGNSWGLRFALHGAIDTNLETAPSGFVNRSDTVDATNESAGHDTNGKVSSVNYAQVSVGGTSDNWVTQTIEIIRTTTYAALIDVASDVDSGFSGSPDNTDPYTSGQSVSYAISTALPTGTYYWRVRAKDSSGTNSYGAWSPTYNFIVRKPIVSLNSPSNGVAVTATPTLNFTGNSIDGLNLEYNVIADTDSGFASWFGINLLQNPSFELDLDGTDPATNWGRLNNAAGCTRIVASDYAYSGSHSLKISAASAVDEGLYQSSGTRDGNIAMPIVPGAKYRFSGYIKTALTTGQAHFHLKTWDSGYSQGYEFDTTRYTGTNDWTYTEYTFTASAGQTIAEVICCFGSWGDTAAGSAWFDNLRFERIPMLLVYSESDSGFTSGHPYASDSAVDYTVQSALTSGTYYWAVRAKEPSGSNSFGDWSSANNFTINHKLESFIDNFDDNSINSSLWEIDTNSGGTIDETNQQISITPGTSSIGHTVLTSMNQYDLTDSYAQVRVIQTANITTTDTILVVCDYTYTDGYVICRSGDYLVALTWGAGNLASEAYNSTAMQYWRIREASGTIYFEFSATGLIGSWNILHSMAKDPWDIKLSFTQIGTNEWSSDSSPIAAIFDDFNVIPNPKSHTLTDNFNAGSIDSAKWNYTTGGNGSVQQSGGKLIITPPTNEIYSYYLRANGTYDLTDSYIQVKVTQPATGSKVDTILHARSSTESGSIFIKYQSGYLYACSWADGDYTSAAYNSTNMLYWRIRETSGTIYFEYSPSGDVGSWTILYSMPTSNISYSMSIRPILEVNEWDVDTNPGIAWYDNFNMPSNPKADTFSDDFNDNSLDTNKWQAGGNGSATISETNYHLVITPTTNNIEWANVGTVNNYNMVNSYAQVKVPHVTTGTHTETTFHIRSSDETASIYFRQNVGTLFISTWDNSTLASATYDATAMLYWQVRDSSGTTYFEYSATGATGSWTTLYSTATPIFFDSIKILLEVNEYDSPDPNPGYAIFDSVNTSQKPSIHSLVDDFNDNSIDSAKWTTSGAGNVSETNGSLSITPVANTTGITKLVSVNSYSLINSYAQIKNTQVANANTDTSLAVSDSDTGSHGYLMIVSNGTLYAQSITGGNLASTAFNATTMSHWRITEHNGIVYWQYSEYGALTAWATLYSQAAEGWEDSIKVNLMVNEWASTATPGTAKFDNFNNILTYIGSSAGTSSFGSTFDIDLSNIGLIAGDLVIVATGFAYTTQGNPGVTTSGYTEVAHLYANDDRDANFSVNYKIMGETPDTKVTCNSIGSINYTSGCIAYAWRGADQSTPLDATTTTDSGTNSSIPDGPSIVPSTFGSVVVTTGLGTLASADNDIVAPTGYVNQANISGTGFTATIAIGIASKLWVSGSENPDVWTNWTTTTSDSWAAATLALKPMSPLIPNASPTVALNNPSDNYNTTDSTPQLSFTGTDVESNHIEYDVQIDLSSNFNSQLGDSAGSIISSFDDLTGGWGSYGSSALWWGQSFDSGSGGPIGVAQFKLQGGTGLTGSCYACIYNHSGTWGSSGIPVGDPLATSNLVDASTITSTSAIFINFYFTGNNRIYLDASTKYCLVFKYSGNGTLSIGYNNTGSQASGNSFNSTDWTTWTPDAAKDVFYYIYQPNMIPLVEAFSSSDGGFTAGHPFSSGTTIDYTIQNALPSGTYYWRARAIDPDGSNSYGYWSSTRAINIVSKIELLSDTFDDNHLDSYKWDTDLSGGGNIIESGQKLIITPGTSTTGTNELFSSSKYDLTGSYVQVKISQTANSSTCYTDMIIYEPTYTHGYVIRIDGANLEAMTLDAGTLAGITYSATSMAYVRIRELNGTIFFEYSPYGTASYWTTLHSISAESWPVTGCHLDLRVYEHTSDSNPGAAWFDNLNYIPQYQPSMTLNSPSNSSITSSTLPIFSFTGTDYNADSIEYNIQIASNNIFSAQTIDSYTSASSSYAFSATTTKMGQSFTVSSSATIGNVKFRLFRTGSPTGNIYAKFYAHTGTYGTTSLPTGSALVVSDPIDVSTISSSSYQWITFNFSDSYTLNNGNYYVIAIEYEGSDASNYITATDDGTYVTHGGNECGYESGVWSAYADYDMAFQINAYYYELNKISTTDTGFTVGHPFNSGLSVSYTTQATIPYGIYYWRARGQDPNGSNSYGEWSSTYSLTISLGGGIKVWDGNSWTMKPVKVWDGNSWVTKPLKVWTGSSWELK